MKTTLSAIALFATATTSYAGNLSFNTQAEYAVEAGGFTLTGGTNYDFGALDVFASADFAASGPTDINFNNMGLGASFDLTAATKVYGKVELDGNLEYSETVIGVAATF